MSVSADADLHVHVDPLIGGGIGTTVKLLGSATPSVSASAQTAVFQFEGRSITFAAPVIKCSAIDLQVETNGQLAIAGGWVTVPKIGVRTGQLIGKDPLKPIVLSGIPAVVPLLAKSDEVEGAAEGSRVIFKQGLYLTSTIASLDVQPNTDGYRFAASLEVAVSNDPPDTGSRAEYASRLNKAAQDFWEANYHASCPSAPDLRVLVGDLEFGPNNEIIKFILNAWNDITKGPGKNNEIVKLVNRVNAAASTYDNDTKKLASQVGDAARKAFPNDSGVGHAAGELAKSVTIAVTNPVGAAGGLIRQIGRGFR